MLRKLFMAALLLGASAGLAPQAQAFPVLPYVTFLGYTATATIANPYPAPMTCFGTLYGYRSDNFTQWMNYTFVTILPGATQFAYIYSGGYFPYMGASSTAECWLN